MDEPRLVGRHEEKALLLEKYASRRSEFVALYGRRRVGKTFLVRSVLAGKFTFAVTGLANAALGDQLANFSLALKEQYPRLAAPEPTGWMEAFQVVKSLVARSRQKKKVVFIDELPWFDTPHSGFIPALEHFWNSWASARNDVMLVVCGSAASWMINRLVNNRGGLHNRVTQTIRVDPFTLGACAELMSARRIALDRYQLVQLYMVLGGVPYYWDAVKKGESAPQTINRLCFAKNGLLVNEFRNLFKSLFLNAGRHEAIVAALAGKGKGLTRDEISAYTGLANGGGLTRLLDELGESGFIRRYRPFGKAYRNSLYQLCDFFSLFHLRFMKGGRPTDGKHWLKLIDSPRHRAWSGYAFEQVCLAHIPQIKSALGIAGVATEVSSWRNQAAGEGAQIDLVIDRRDGVINLFEMKFSLHPFVITKKYDAELRNKAGVFTTETGTKKAVFMSMVTTFGLKQNAYSGNVQNAFRMEVLFGARSES